MALDITVTPQLKREGIARELVNRIQNLRKSSGLDITDRIVVTIAPDERTNDAVNEHAAYIAQQVLANDIRIEPVQQGTALDMDGWQLMVHIAKA